MAYRTTLLPTRRLSALSLRNSSIIAEFKERSNTCLCLLLYAFRAMASKNYASMHRKKQLFGVVNSSSTSKPLVEPSDVVSDFLQIFVRPRL